MQRRLLLRLKSQRQTLRLNNTKQELKPDLLKGTAIHLYYLAENTSFMKTSFFSFAIRAVNPNVQLNTNALI